MITKLNELKVKETLTLKNLVSIFSFEGKNINPF